MRGFTAGLIAGSVIGVVGLSYAFSDSRARRRLVRDTRHVAEKAGDIVSFWGK